MRAKRVIASSNEQGKQSIGPIRPNRFLNRQISESVTYYEERFCIIKNVTSNCVVWCIELKGELSSDVDNVREIRA